MTRKRMVPRLEKQIDDNLRRVYSELASEPVPDRFTQLLEQLKEQERSQSASTGRNEKTK